MATFFILPTFPIKNERNNMLITGDQTTQHIELRDAAMAQKQEKPADQLIGQAKCDQLELGSIRDVKAYGTAPDICGLDVVKVAPARGPVVPFVPTVLLPDGEDGYKAVELGFRGRSAMRQKDVFDKMVDQSAKHKGQPPFNRNQIGCARDYRSLTEKCMAAGIKCSNVFQVGSGQQGRVDFMDAYIRDSDRLKRFHRAIGQGTSLVVRRVRPSVRGSNHIITDWALVNLVCLGDMDLSAVLARFKWSIAGKNRKSLQGALCGILDRMMMC